MSTRIYGTSDDLIEMEGDVSGEVGCEGHRRYEHGLLMILSDGTLLEIRYGKADMAIWGIAVISAGSLFEKLDPCDDEDAKIYSDIACFKDGLKWAYAATEWERVK